MRPGPIAQEYVESILCFWPKLCMRPSPIAQEYVEPNLCFWPKLYMRPGPIAQEYVESNLCFWPKLYMRPSPIAQEYVESNRFYRRHSVYASGRVMKASRCRAEHLAVRGPVSTRASIRLVLKSAMLKWRPLQNEGTLCYFVAKGPPSL